MKRITSFAISLAILLTMASCNGNTPAQTTVGSDAPIAPPETETVVTTGGASPSPTETVETTETTAPEPAFPEFDINSEECLMYRLLDMTVEEIEAEFGEMTLHGIIAGGTPCYELPEYGMRLLFGTYPDVLNAPLPRDACPEYAETAGNEAVVHPGIYVGMASNELIDKIGINGISLGMSDFNNGFVSSYLLDGYWISVLWDVPEERYNEAAEAIIWGEESEEETAKAELIADMRSGDANVKVKRITISKGIKNERRSNPLKFATPA